jgi:hypothetical protein
MANIVIPNGAVENGAIHNDPSSGMGSVISAPVASDRMSVRTALRLAWVTWVVLLLIPFFLFLGAVWATAFHESTRTIATTPDWFLGASGYLLVVVPAAFFWRNRLFKPYYSGHPIEPSRYLYGMLAMWVALEFGGIISLLGCFITDSLLPSLLPALVAFMFYVTQWPNGNAMVRSIGDAEDASVYKEPR